MILNILISSLEISIISNVKREKFDIISNDYGNLFCSL